jgi:hypothetical protein
VNAATDWWYWSLNLFRSDVIAAPTVLLPAHHTTSRQVANTLAALIIGGALTSLEARTTEGVA